jgi:hypothetical protein
VNPELLAGFSGRFGVVPGRLFYGQQKQPHGPGKVGLKIEQN